MPIHVYIDSCAWNFLFEKKIDLRSELPAALYALYITREVEIELASIPNNKDGKDNQNLKNYIAESIGLSKVATTAPFGFCTLEPEGTPSKIQTYGGFNQGTFQSTQERDYYASPEVRTQLIGKRIKKSGLSAHQADASLAVHATSAIVLTDESPTRGGPLKLAKSKGAKIVYLSAEVAPSGLSLGAYLAQIE